LKSSFDRRFRTSASATDKRNGTDAVFKSNHPHIERMVRAGELEVSRDRHGEAEAHFNPHFLFHRSGDATLGYEGVGGYFASLRHAFPVEIRREIAFGEGEFIAARTVFRGTFTNGFTGRGSVAAWPSCRVGSDEHLSLR
jgi:hypothetical protein